MMRRRRPLLRAAAVGGGAYMAGKHNANRQAEAAQYQQDQDARISNLEAQQYQQQPQYQQAPPAPEPPPAPAPAAAPSPMIDQLNQLATLHQQGILSDDEFAAAKAKLLGS
jgi:outer membrane murein-binding lipoprotein Lpp